MNGYHFTAKTLRDGRPIPAIGEWIEHDGAVIMCESGLHASPTAFAALQYAPGQFLHRVDLDGDLIEHVNDKSVGRRRKIIATIDATNVLRLFARTVALEVIHLWIAPPIVREYLETGDESKRDAAWAAARDAAGDAARAAAWYAARAAAWYAAGPAARDAAGDKYTIVFNTLVDEAFAAQEAQCKP